MDTVASSIDKDTKPAARFFREMLLLMLIMGSVAVGCRVLAYVCLHDFANSADEWAYQFQAMTLAQGDLYSNPIEQQEALNPFFIITHDERVFSIFPPGWPALLSLGERINRSAWVNPALTALSFGLLWVIARRLWDTTTAWIALALFGLSPWVWFNGASYFAHPACLLFVLGAIRTLLLLRKSFCPYKTMFAGLLIACAFAVREYTTVLLLAPFLLMCIAEQPRKLRYVASLLVGAAPIVGLLAMYNTALTGAFWMPARFLLESEGLGFGTRTITVFDYREEQTFGPLDGLTNLLVNTGRLFLWTLPGLPLLALAGGWLERRNRMVLALGGGVMLLMLGYVLYPSDGGNQYGPRFYYEASAILALLGARALIAISTSNTITKRTGMLLLLLLGLGSVALFSAHARYFAEQIEQRTTLYRLVEQRNLDHALVFVGAPSGDMTQGDLIRNPPGLQANVLYAWELGPRNAAVMAALPEREFFRFGRDALRGTAFLESLPVRVGEIQRPK